MKNYILIYLLMTTSLTMAQDYFVLQVKGQVKRTKSGATVKTKDVIKADEQLTFSSPTDAVAVVNPKSGRYIIKPGAPTKKNELFAFVKDALNQASSRLSTRSGGFNNVLDFQTYFKDPILLLPELRYKVNGASYPINDNSFFYIEYQYKGEAIPKQLKINPDSLIIIDRTELFKIDGQPIAAGETSGHQLMYFNNGSASMLSSIQFNLAEVETVKSEISVLTDALNSEKATSKKITDETMAYLLENYAKVDESNLKRWLNLK